MSQRFSLFILFAMLLGVAVGWVCHLQLDAAQASTVAANLSIVTDVFLRLIKMIIAPLVFATLIAGIANMGVGAQLGQIGARTVLWFLGASIISLLLGLVLVNLLQPGAGLSLALPAETTNSAVQASALSFKEFVTHVFPRSIFEAMAANEILQIVVFSLFMGVALASLGERTAGIVDLAEQMVEVMLKITGYVMMVAPFAVFAAIAAIIAQNGLGILVTYSKFILSFYFALVVLWVVLAGFGWLVIGRRVVPLISSMRDPILVAFSTASSEAAFPRILEQLRRFGVPRRIAGFVLPLGYSFNLDGSMMYCTFATLFIAQVYGIELSIAQQATMLLILLITSKGIAGVPRASLVVIAATLAYFDLPEAGLVLIFAIDQFLDMGRSATNVVGNAIASAVQAKWAGQLLDGPADEATLVVVAMVNPADGVGGAPAR
jgi:Na+/H+-dicarboxylate symporter